MARKLKRPWLYSYLDYVDELGGPSQFKFWAGVSAVASTLKNHVRIKYGNYDVFPNQYIILVGTPGIGKGTAINPAVNLVKKAGTANYISDRITSEKVLQTLETGFAHTVTVPSNNGTGPAQIVQSTGDKTATILSTELPVFLGSSDWMIPLMCEMWEKGEFQYATKTKGSITATGLCVSMFGACVPEYIRNLSKISTSFITSGFSSRCIFVFASDRGKLVSWPTFDNSRVQLENDLIDDLKYISQLNGEYKLDAPARELWDQFFDSLKPNEFESDIVTNFKARMISHVIKLSIILAASESDSLIIKKDHLYNAIQKIQEVRNNLDIAFRSIGESSLAVAQDRIIRYVQMKGITTRGELFRDNMRHISDEDLDRVLRVLEATSYIRITYKGNKCTIESLDKTFKVKGATP